MKNQKLKIVAAITGVFSLLFAIIPAFAHVVVKPNQTGVAAFQTFTIGVPNEKDMPTVALRLVIPDGLKSVSPNVKPGWKIDVKKAGSDDNAPVTEISWTNGSIPAGQRDDFFFSAQVPSDETSVNWKAYQTYQDGAVVSWDQDPSSLKNMNDDQKEKLEKQGKGPYSQTKIVNDLKPTAANTSNVVAQSSSSNVPTVLSIVAIALSAVSLWMAMQKKK